MKPAYERAWAIIGRLAHVATDVVVCPGSRSTPLTLVADAHPGLRTHVVLDERGAGYFALGIARASRRPAVVVTTSGTAVANLLPACVEANEANIPLVLVTADRPPRLRHSGANQTIDQVDIFHRQVRMSVDLGLLDPAGSKAALEALHAMAKTAGPVHLNVPFDEPLEPDRGDLETPRLPDAPELPDPPPGPVSWPELRGRGLLVAGPAHMLDLAPVGDLASRQGIPLLADPLSGLRDHPQAISAFDAWIEAAPKPDWVVQCGAAMTSKALNAWLAGTHRIRIGGRDDVGGATLLDAPMADACRSFPAEGDSAWMQAWQEADAAARQELRALPGTEAGVLQAVVAAMEAGGLRTTSPSTAEGQTSAAPLVIGNSLPVRDLDRFGGPFAFPVHGNRGASGIDGQIATAAGIQQATGAPVTLLLGDLSTQHDVGSLALARRPLRIVVIQNGGGGIFRHLPLAGGAGGDGSSDGPEAIQPDRFDRFFLTPQSVDLVRVAEGFGLRAGLVSPAELAAALARPFCAEGEMLVVPVDGEASAAYRKETRARATAAAADAFATGMVAKQPA